MKFPGSVICFVIFVASLSACEQQATHKQADIELSMAKYDSLIKKMDVDSIALLFTADGDLGNIAHGRDSISHFLSGFKNIKVLSQNSTTDSVRFSVDTAWQKGEYHQTDLVSPGDTVRVKGSFIAVWQWMTEGGWHIRRIDTQPMK